MSIEVEESRIFESCRLSPIREENSVLEVLRDKRLEQDHSGSDLCDSMLEV